MKRININLSDREYEYLRKTAYESGISMSAMVRLYLAVKKDVTKGTPKIIQTEQNFSKDFYPVPKLGKKKRGDK